MRMLSGEPDTFRYEEGVLNGDGSILMFYYTFSSFGNPHSHCLTEQGGILFPPPSHVLFVGVLINLFSHFSKVAGLYTFGTGK